MNRQADSQVDKWTDRQMKYRWTDEKIEELKVRWQDKVFFSSSFLYVSLDG
jgi:hypothetical protein